MRRFRRVIAIVLDSFGIGELPDADGYGDRGADTAGHVAEACGLHVPRMAGLGLSRIARVPGDFAAGGFGRLAEQSAGKDTIAGHWEMMGVVTRDPFRTYPDGFPPELVEGFARICGREPLGNCAASGTEILDRLGAEHVRTGRPILYTSADSVFQVAAHEEVVPVATLHRWCEEARRMLVPPHQVGRVIARPFVGAPGTYKRTPNRHDYAITPPSATVLDRLVAAGQPVIGIGKIPDIYAHRGVTHEIRTRDDADGLRATRQAMETCAAGLVFTNLVELDQTYGHRRDVRGYARQLEAIDQNLAPVMSAMGESDLLLLTADHGTDPTFRGTDHTREWVPALAWCPGIQDSPLGDRTTIADLGATVLEALAPDSEPVAGRSFLAAL